LDDVQSVGPVIGFAVPPRAAHVFYFDPGSAGGQLAADAEGAAPGAGVQDGVGGQLVSDEHKVVTRRAARQVARDLAADLADLVGLAVECALV